MRELTVSTRQQEGTRVAAHPQGGENGGAHGLPIIVLLFILSLLIPISVNIGPIRLSAYRVILLIAIIPALQVCLNGGAGKFRLADICVVIIGVWSSLSLIVHHDLGTVIEPVGILNIELVGAYLMGRAYIRTPEHFYRLSKLLFIIAVIMLPFAVLEAVTDQKIMLKIFRAVGGDWPTEQMGKRWGLSRVQGPLEHPILYGVFFGSIIGLVYFVLGYGKSVLARMFSAVLVFATAALSLSSGPLAAMSTQVYLIVWERTLKNFRYRWYLFLALLVVAYVVVDMVSTRDPFRVFAYYFSFSAHTAYNRIFIFQFGLDNMLGSPLFGIGLNDWVRPSYMSSSFDMFWMFQGMRYGVPVLFFYILLFFSIIVAVVRARNIGEKVIWYRMGFVTSMFGFFIAGWTVHYWNASYVFFIFVAGSGLWIADYVQPNEDTGRDQEAVEPRQVVYTRFPGTHSPSK